MSTSTGELLPSSPYRAALAAPGAVAPALWSALGRLPVAMYALASLLYVQGTTGSFAVAGLVSAGALIGVGVGSVVQGRLVDRLGPTRPLLVAAALFAATAAVFVSAVEAAATVPVLMAAAAATGLVQPALPGASRALWSRLVPPGPLRDAAYTYEAISMEVFFIVGPALAALLVAAPWPGTGFVTAASATVLGAAGFALTAAVRAVPPGEPRPGLLGPLAHPGVRTVALAGLGFGLVVGGVEVGVPAVAAESGSRLLGGVLISAWSVVSVLAGLVYARRPWPGPLAQRLPVLLGVFGLLVAAMGPAGAGGSLVALTTVMMVAGAVLTPQVTAHSLALEVVAPPGTAAEAFGWVVTAITMGVAVGQSAGGVVVEVAGAPAAFLAGGLAGVVVAGVLWLRRATVAA